MPISVIVPPTKSVAASLTPSIILSQRRAVTTYTHPYAAYIRPLAAGWRVNNQAKIPRLTTAGINN